MPWQPAQVSSNSVCPLATSPSPAPAATVSCAAVVSDAGGPVSLAALASVVGAATSPPPPPMDTTYATTLSRSAPETMLAGMTPRPCAITLATVVSSSPAPASVGPTPPPVPCGPWQPAQFCSKTDAPAVASPAATTTSSVLGENGEMSARTSTMPETTAKPPMSHQKFGFLRCPPSPAASADWPGSPSCTRLILDVSSPPCQPSTSPPSTPI